MKEIERLRDTVLALGGSWPAELTPEQFLRMGNIFLSAAAEEPTTVDPQELARRLKDRRE